MLLERFEMGGEEREREKKEGEGEKGKRETGREFLVLYP